MLSSLTTCAVQVRGCPSTRRKFCSTDRRPKRVCCGATCYQEHSKQQYSRGLLSIIASKHHVQKKGKASLSLRTGNNQTPETKTKNQHVPSVLAPHTSTTARCRRHEHCPITPPIRSLLAPPAAALRHYSFTDVTTHLWRSAS